MWVILCEVLLSRQQLAIITVYKIVPFCKAPISCYEIFNVVALQLATLLHLKNFSNSLQHSPISLCENLRKFSKILRIPCLRKEGLLTETIFVIMFFDVRFLKLQNNPPERGQFFYHRINIKLPISHATRVKQRHTAYWF